MKVKVLMIITLIFCLLCSVSAISAGEIENNVQNDNLLSDNPDGDLEGLQTFVGNVSEEYTLSNENLCGNLQAKTDVDCIKIDNLLFSDRNVNSDDMYVVNNTKLTLDLNYLINDNENTGLLSVYDLPEFSRIVTNGTASNIDAIPFSMENDFNKLQYESLNGVNVLGKELDIDLLNNNMEYTLYANNVTRFYKEDLDFKVLLVDSMGKGVANATVRFIVGDIAIPNKTNDEGIACLSFPFVGGHYIVNSSYGGYFILNTLDILPTPNYTISNDLKVNYSENIVFRLAEYMTGSISININNTNHTLRISRGQAIFDKNDLLPGFYNITINYPGDHNYASKTVLSNVTILKVSNYTINVSSIIKVGGDLIISMPSDAEGSVSVSVNGTNFTGNIKNGIVNVSLKDFNNGTYDVIVSYNGDAKYNSKTVNSKLAIVKEEFILTAFNLTKYYGSSNRFVVNLTDGDYNPIKNASLIVNINGQVYSRQTNENGTMSMAINLHSGVYHTIVRYGNISANATITILSTVNGTDIVKIFRNATQYYATFRDTNGNYLKDGTEITFNINGVIYHRFINGSYGRAGMNINLQQGEYIITATNPVNNEMYSNNITVLPKLIENRDIIKYFKNDTQYSVKIIGSDGKDVGAGKSVTFNVNGVFYTRMTNENSVASIKINLAPDKYIITAEYENCKVSNNITILPVLSAKDLTKKYGSSDQFVATLLDGQGKVYANQNVTFNINGVFYQRTTNSNGEARLNINLMPGEYIITSMYSNGATISNKVTIKS